MPAIHRESSPDSNSDWEVSDGVTVSSSLASIEADSTPSSPISASDGFKSSLYKSATRQSTSSHAVQKVSNICCVGAGYVGKCQPPHYSLSFHLQYCESQY